MTRPTRALTQRLLDRLRREIRVRQMSYATEKSYALWVRRFVLFHGKRHPKELAEAEVNAFLNYLANDRRVSASTQTQALCAILFLYRHVLGRNLGDLSDLVRVKRKRNLPVVLTQDEVRRLLSFTEGVPRLVLTLLYGSGLRLAEGLRLRVKDINFSRLDMAVRDGKGGKDRTTMLPAKLVEPLQNHLVIVEELHRCDLRKGHGKVELPYALARKLPTADTDWAWQYVFPSHRLACDPRSDVIRRHHLYPQTVRRAMRSALRKAKINRPATVHTMRHSFATALISNGYDIRTVQELLGHKNVRTTMIYTHVLNRGGHGVKSPADVL